MANILDFLGAPSTSDGDASVSDGSYRKEADLRGIAAFTPEERARSNAYERSDMNRAELLQELDRTRDPKIRALLEEEYAKQFGGEAPGIVAGTRLASLGSNRAEPRFEQMSAPQYRGDSNSILAYLGGGTGGGEDVQVDDIDAILASVRDLPSKSGGNIGRGFDTAWKQLPQVGYGVMAGAGALAETAFGEGGLGTAVKKAGIKGYTEASEEIAKDSKESDSLNYSLAKARDEGDLDAMQAWLGHTFGYVTGQGLQMLMTAGIGAVAGKFVAKLAAKQVVEGMVAKETAKLVAANAGRSAADRVATDQLAKVAAKNVAQKFSTIGQNTALGGAAFGMEGGEIFGGLTSENPDRPLTGTEAGKALLATMAAGSLEFVGDKIGLDIVLGKSPFLKPAQFATGVGGRVARGGVAATAAAPIEGTTEYGQTLIEEWGKGQDPFSQESRDQAFDAAGMGVMGGTVVGGFGGVIQNAKERPVDVPVPSVNNPSQPLPPTDPIAGIGAANSADEAIYAFNLATRRADLMGRGSNDGLMSAIREGEAAAAEEARLKGPTLTGSERSDLLGRVSNADLMGGIREREDALDREVAAAELARRQAPTLTGSERTDLLGRGTNEGLIAGIRGREDAEAADLDALVAREGKDLQVMRADFQRDAEDQRVGKIIEAGRIAGPNAFQLAMQRAQQDADRNRAMSAEQAPDSPNNGRTTTEQAEQAGQTTENAAPPPHPSVLPGDLTTKPGAPYTSQNGARLRKESLGKKGDDYEITPVTGGFVVRPKTTGATGPAAPVSGATPTSPTPGGQPPAGGTVVQVDPTKPGDGTLEGRIAAVVARYDSEGMSDHGDMIRKSPVRNKPTEASVKFWEEAQAKNIARRNLIKGADAGTNPPITPKHWTADNLYEGDSELKKSKAVPKSIVDAMLGKINALVDEAAKAGVGLEDIDGNFPQALRDLKKRKSELHGAVIRYMRKLHAILADYKTAKPDAFLQEEGELSEELGIDLKALREADGKVVNPKLVPVSKRNKEEEDAEAEAARLAEEIRIAMGGEPNEKPMGWYGDVDEPLKFISGMSAPADFLAGLEAGKNVGVSINALSDVSIPKLAEALAATENSHLFVDSGAFSVFMANIRAKSDGQAEFDEFGEKGMDFDAIFERYAALEEAVARAADDGGDVNARVFFVMPDIVGDQAGSLELVKRYADKINQGIRNIVPLQGGELSLKQAYETMMKNLGLDPAVDLSPILGIPSKAAAVSNKEFKELLDKYEDQIMGVHILGAVADKTLQPRLDQLREAGYVDGNVSADANRLRSLMWGDTTRAVAMRELLHGDALAKPIKKDARLTPVSQREDAPMSDEDAAAVGEAFDSQVRGQIDDGFRVTHVFDAPAKGDVVRLTEKAGVTQSNEDGSRVFHRELGWMSLKDAKGKIANWRAHAKAQGKSRVNSQKVVLSLFDRTGTWALPWEDAGYQVFTFDIQNDEMENVSDFSVDYFVENFAAFDGMDVHAILAACPCNDFSSAGSRFFKEKDADGRTDKSVELVMQTLRTIEFFKPAIWAIENPVGRIEKAVGLTPWRLSFQPFHMGDPSIKQTQLWGRFNADLPVLPVEPVNGSEMNKVGGNSIETKNARSVTPTGFAYSFFMANNAVDHPVMAIANKYDRLDRGLIEQAVNLNVTEDQIDSAVEDFYYQDLNDEGANDALRELIEEAGGQAPVESETTLEYRLGEEFPELGSTMFARALHTGGYSEAQLRQLIEEDYAAGNFDRARLNLDTVGQAPFSKSMQGYKPHKAKLEALGLGPPAGEGKKADKRLTPVSQRPPEPVAERIPTKAGGMPNEYGVYLPETPGMEVIAMPRKDGKSPTAEVEVVELEDGTWLLGNRADFTSGNMGGHIDGASTSGHRYPSRSDALRVGFGRLTRHFDISADDAGVSNRQMAQARAANKWIAGELAKLGDQRLTPVSQRPPVVQPEGSQVHQTQGKPVEEVPVADLKLSKDVAQFKDGADAKGVTERLGGKFDRALSAPLQVWKRLNGDMEVISGRHRLDLAQRSGEATVPAQVHNEADNFSAKDAEMLDIELNVKDGRGKVKDYIRYFKASNLERQEAQERGLLQTAVGRNAYAIADAGSDELIAAHGANEIGDQAAVQIAQAAPGDGALQAAGMRQVMDGKTITQAVNTMHAVKLMVGEGRGNTSEDMFGFDESAMKDAQDMAKVASGKQRAISEKLSAIRGAARRPELAAREGVNVNDPAALAKRIEELESQREAWDRWPTSPDLVAEIRAELKPGEQPAAAPSLDLAAPTRADVLAQQAAKEAEEQRQRDGGDKPIQRPPPTGDQIDLLNPQAGIFDAPAEPDAEPDSPPNPDLLRAQADVADAAAEIARLLSGSGRSNIVPEEEAKLVPLLVKLFDAGFRAGYHAFKDLAKFALETLKKVLSKVTYDAITLKHLQGAYISMSSGKTDADEIEAVVEVKAKETIEKHTARRHNEPKAPNESSPDKRVERDSADPAAGGAVGKPVSNGLREPADGSGEPGGQGGGTGGGLTGTGSISPGGTTTGGKRSNKPVSDGNGTNAVATPSDAGTGFSGGSGNGRVDGIPDDPIPAGSVNKTATSGDARIKKRDAQKAANKIPVKPGIDNIRETLPFLLPQQQEDVAKAEERFAKPDGYGMLFTNGTGTGKTYTGLGVIKRFERQGKTNILIVVPNDKGVDDWTSSARDLDLAVTRLENTKDAGKGIVITTYANLGENDALASRQWDLVVPDETQALMMSANGDMTTYLSTLRAITNHPRGVYQRYQMLNRADVTRQDLINKEIEKRRKGGLGVAELQAELVPLQRKLRAELDKVRDEVDKMQGVKRSRMVALSATPFAYEKTIEWAEGYLLDYNENYPYHNTGRDYNTPDPRQYYFITNFGYSMRMGKLNEPGPKVDRGTLQRQWNSNMKRAGVLSGRMLDVDADYDRRFVLIDSAIGNKIDEALEYLNEQARDAAERQKTLQKGEAYNYGASHLQTAIAEQFTYLQRRYLLEAIKAEAIIPIVKKHLELGRKVVVFHDYKKGGVEVSPFDIEPKTPEANDENSLFHAANFNRELAKFKAAFPQLLEPLNDLDSPLEIFPREIPGTLIINGDEPAKAVLKRFDDFQNDDTGPMVALVQSNKNTGWSGHDTTGKHQRVEINLGQPTAPTTAVQQEGRIYRTGQVSDAIFRYVNTGTTWERTAFADRVANRASAQENLGMGEAARGLKDSFISAFEESDKYEPGHEGEGTGGKERDKAGQQALTEWDRAKSFYWGTQKKNSRTKAQEGKDFFPTPEPVGLKMVEWLDLRGGEDTLEPSAGFGSIARWLPENTKRTAIEPSSQLRSRLMMVMDTKADRIIGGNFEDLDVVNKYDGIAMNPPFGKGGKLAMEHIALAATHLRDGGRIVAVIPTGPEADQRWEKWFNAQAPADHPDDFYTEIGGQGQDGKTYLAFRRSEPGLAYGSGNTAAEAKERAIAAWRNLSPKAKNWKQPKDGMWLVADIKLPRNTFERAGTGQPTRIVILEKSQNVGETIYEDLTDADDNKDINDLFDRIENMGMPQRTEPREQAEAPEVAAPVKKAKPQAPKVGDTVTLSDGKQYEVVTYITNAGKEIHGVWVATRELALANARSTFRKGGMGFWVSQAALPKVAGDSLGTALKSRVFYGRSKFAEGLASHTQAFADAQEALGFTSPVSVLTENRPDLPNTPMRYDLGQGVILYNTAVPRSRAADVQYMMEEILHSIDHVGGDKTISASSPRLLPGGDLHTELKSAHRASAAMRDVLDHPFGNKAMSDTESAAELFARTAMLYHANSELLRITAPKTYETHRRLFSGTAPKNNVGLSSPLQQLRRRGGETGQPDGRGPGVRGSTAGGTGQGRADGLHSLRQAIAGAIGGQPLGARVTFNGPDGSVASRKGGAYLNTTTYKAGQTTRAHTPEQLRAMRNTGQLVDVPSLKDRAAALWKDAGKSMAQGIVDQFAPVKELNRTAYGLLRLAKGATGALESFLHGGMLKLTNNVYDFDETKRGGVLDRWLKPMMGEHHDFLRWVAAHRAERLATEDRENLFTDDDIAAFKTLADGELPFNYTMQHGPRAGQITRVRSDMYKDSLKTFNEFNTNMLDMGEQSGLFNAEDRASWESMFYVPFWRVADEGAGGVRGMNIKNGVVRQKAFERLKGGSGKLNVDLLDNTLMNWAHMLDASAKNRAAKATIEAAEAIGKAIGSNQHALAQMAASIGNRDGLVWFMDEGVKRYSLVDDKYLLTALTALEYAGMRSPIMTALGSFKHALTVGVTASPFFKVRNLIRDSLTVIGTGQISYNFAANVKDGWKLTDPKSDSYFRLLAGGGTIHFGTMYEGSEGRRVQALIESGVDATTILGDDHSIKAFWRNKMEPWITAYNELGNRGEAVNRASLYAQLREQGVDHAEASLQARDLMDFSMQGSFAAIRFLSQVVPFFNARLQGAYKLGRAANEDPARLGAVMGGTALFSLALLLKFSDDEDWKKREEWDRNNYWWFKLGGTAYRIPKPFEIGAVATLAERGWELAFDKEMNATRFRKQVMKLLGDNLSMNPVPQMVKPIIEVYANQNSFTGRPIESMGQEKLRPEYRFNAGTSMTARAASTAMNSVTNLIGVDAASPVQIDHMIQGYFGWLGAHIVGFADVVARPISGQPDRPAPDYWKVATGGMIAGLRDAPSRYVSQMYEQAKELEQAHGTWRSLQKEGKTLEAAEFADDNRDELGRFKAVASAKRNMSALNERIRVIERSNMDGDQKRALIRQIQAQRERTAMSVAP